MMETPKSLGIGMIGYGGIGRVHAMGYRDIGFHYGLPAAAVRLAGVATTKADTAEKAAREIGCPVWTDNYRELLARDDIQAVDVCVPNDRHEEIVLAAAAAGKHIYCEKPLALDPAQAARMAAAVSLLCCGPASFSMRCWPAASSPSEAGISAPAIFRPSGRSRGASAGRCRAAVRSSTLGHTCWT